MTITEDRIGGPDTESTGATAMRVRKRNGDPVSYSHLTLPTRCSV